MIARVIRGRYRARMAAPVKMASIVTGVSVNLDLQERTVLKVKYSLSLC